LRRLTDDGLAITHVEVLGEDRVHVASRRGNNVTRQLQSIAESVVELCRLLRSETGSDSWVGSFMKRPNRSGLDRCCESTRGQGRNDQDGLGEHDGCEEKAEDVWITVLLTRRWCWPTGHSYLFRSDTNTTRLTSPHASQLVAPPIVFALRRIWCWLVLELGKMFRCGTTGAQAPVLVSSR
jgi:hypothetical protein